MSEKLKDALETIKEWVDACADPVLYLHDPATGKIFASILTDPDMVDQIPNLDPYKHSHCEYDMDDDV